MRVSWSYQRMPMVSRRSTSRSLLPTSSTMPLNESEPAIPCWMLLITASSALRCRSASKLRAFCSARLSPAATEPIRSTSALPKA